jgi:preprotein translocase subunit SecG
MSIHSILLTIQIVVSIFLIGAVLLQAQGSGLGTTWGGGGESFHTRRGVERVLFTATILLIAVFFVVSMLSVVIS